jgi:leucyl-tRNA synthetase
MVLKDGTKMSKSKGNTVDPQGLINEYGADTVRLFTMFAAPPEQSLEWADSGVDGASRFLKRLWKQVYMQVSAGTVEQLNKETLNEQQKALRLKLHETIKKVSDDIGRRYTFNTAIASVMELMNEIARFNDDSAQGRAVMQESLDAVVLLLSPIVPHICHYLWQQLGHSTSVIDERWPVWDESALLRDSIEMIVQVNGKLRAKIQVPADADNNTVETLAKENDNVKAHTEGKTIRKVIVVPGRLVNLVVG